MPTPQRSNRGNDSQSYEGLLVSALLRSKQFTPERYSVSEEDIEGLPKLWAFCTEYQARAGHAPPVPLVRAKFPGFVYTSKIDPTWAASKVLDESQARAMRLGIRDSLSSLKDEDVGSAYAALESIPRPRTHVKEPVSVFDHALIEEAFDVSKIEVPYPSLQKVTGGIGPAELWLYGARWWQGKSWLLCKQASFAARAGYNVLLLSYEMPAMKVSKRLMRIFAERDGELLRAIRNEDVAEYKWATDMIAERITGKVAIQDTSYGNISSVNYVSQACSSGMWDLVMVDHVGLMKDSQGHRAGEDWRYHASISNVLKEITGETHIPILGAIQVNREGDRTGPENPPKGSQAAGTDSLGQDADVMVMHKRWSERVMVHRTEKNREGAAVKFYSHFDVKRSRWDEMDRDEGARIAAEDGDFNSE